MGLESGNNYQWLIVNAELSYGEIYSKLDWILRCALLYSNSISSFRRSETHGALRMTFICVLFFMQRAIVEQLVQEIKDMNTVFERTEGIGVNWEHEFGFFQEEIGELYEEWISDKSLIGSLDALVDICVFAVGALHKSGLSTQAIMDAVAQSWTVDIWSIATTADYQEHCVAILHTVLVSLQSFVREHTVGALFHEVYLSNMSKLKDGKPVPGNLPGKFGKNMETYFKPDLEKYLH